MAIMDIGAFSTLLDERFREVQEQVYADETDVTGMIYDKMTSDRQVERMSNVGEFGTWPEFAGQLEYDRIYEQYNVAATPREYAVGTRITLRMLEDDLTNIMNGDRFEPMVRSAVTTRNKHAARLFNYMASNDLSFYNRSEAVPLVSNSHTTRTPGVSTATGFDNLTTSALSRTAYRASRILMRKIRNDRGEQGDIIADELWVPIELEPLAREILFSPKQPETNYNAINPEERSGELKVLIHWTDTNDWAICNKRLREKHAKWIERIALQWFRVRDFDTFQAKFAGRGRWGTLVNDWRFIVGAVL